MDQHVPVAQISSKMRPDLCSWPRAIPVEPRLASADQSAPQKTASALQYSTAKRWILLNFRLAAGFKAHRSCSSAKPGFVQRKQSEPTRRSARRELCGGVQIAPSAIVGPNSAHFLPNSAPRLAERRRGSVRLD